MDKRVEKLINFIDEYGRDYLSDGTKKKILSRLNDESEAKKTLREFTEAVDEAWMKRVREVGFFCIFTDYDKRRAENRKYPYFNAKEYMDCNEYKQSNIPTFRVMVFRNKGCHSYESDCIYYY